MLILYSSYNGRIENINWNDRMVEGLNNGLLKEKDNMIFFSLKPTIPLFHYSNVVWGSER
jgi:hypothetical protein